MVGKFGLAAVLALGTAGAANAAVIVSEDFESGPGAFTLTGNVGLATGASYNPCCGTPIDASNTFVAFGGGNLPSGLASAGFNTVLGSTYTVAFDYGAISRFGGTDPLTFTVAGQNFVFSAPANNTLAFTAGSFTFIGTGGSTSLVVTSGGVNNVDAIVDNISVAGAVPEPGVWALMILGFGMVGGAIRRSKPARLAMHPA